MSDEPEGRYTAVDGTPVAVDVSRDRLARVDWLVFLGGPVIWITHFMVVYLVVEAGCSGDGHGFEVFDPPVPAATTLVATGVAALGCVGFAIWAYRRWRTIRQGLSADELADTSGPLSDRHPRGAMDFAGLLLALFSVVAVLFVGLPALVFEC
jgi:hypothetical protein